MKIRCHYIVNLIYVLNRCFLCCGGIYMESKCQDKSHFLRKGVSSRICIILRIPMGVNMNEIVEEILYVSIGTYSMKMHRKKRGCFSATYTFVREEL